MVKKKKPIDLRPGASKFSAEEKARVTQPTIHLGSKKPAVRNAPKKKSSSSSKSKFSKAEKAAVTQPVQKLKPKKLSPRQQALKEHPKLVPALEKTAIGLATVAAGGGIGLGARAALATTTRITTRSTIAAKKIQISNNLRTIVTKLRTKEARGGASGNIGTFKSKIFRTNGGIANNPKNLDLKKSYLIKLANAAKNPYFVLGALGTTLFTSLLWSPNEKGDALLQLSIVQGNAAREGDVELVNKIAEQIEEVYDISASIPVIGFVKSEIAKFEASFTASEGYIKIAETNRAKAEEKAAEPSFADQRKQADEEARERTLANRAEDEKYFDDKKEERRQAELEQRDIDEAYYDQIEDERRAAKLKEREEDEIYYAEIRRLLAEAKAAERTEDEEYYAGILVNENVPSNLGFGLL